MKSTVRGPFRVTITMTDEEHAFVREGTSSREGNMRMLAESTYDGAIPCIRKVGVAAGVESCSETSAPVPSFDFLG
jgi:hypothetical protein